MPSPSRDACRQIEGFVDAYVDGEFDGREALELEAHLSECPDCSHKAKLQQSFKSAMRRAAGTGFAPPRLREAVQARLSDPRAADDLDDEAGQRSPSGRAYRGFSNRTRGVAIAAAVAGAAVWFVAGGLSRPVFGPSALTRGLAEDGAALHARTLPLDYAASDAASVQRWLQGRLDFGVNLPHFQPAAALQGVRLSTVGSRAAAAVSYQMPQAKSRLTLLIVDDPEPKMAGTLRRVADREVYVSHARGYNVASWRRDEIVYSLISDLDERDVLDLVRAAQEH